MSNTFDLKKIARAAATVDGKIVRVPQPRKETKIKALHDKITFVPRALRNYEPTL